MDYKTTSISANCFQDVHRACLQELDSIIECMNADRESLLSICTNFGNVTDRLLSVDQDSRPDEFQFLTVQNCLKSILEKFDSNFDCHSSDEKLVGNGCWYG